MEIFRIRLNSNEFQSFLPVDASIWQTDVLKMDCKSKLSTWKPPEVYIQNPKRERGNFFHLCSGAVVVDSATAERLRTVFEMTGELLPLACEGLAYYLLNVLECVNCLDQRETEWVLGKTTGSRVRIKEYHFHKSRLPESTLFKLPETAAAEILCVAGLKDPEDEFKAQVETVGLKGIRFEKLWSGK